MNWGIVSEPFLFIKGCWTRRLQNFENGAICSCVYHLTRNWIYNHSCPVEATLFLIGGKYKPLILWHLIEKPLHYMELQRLIPKATPKMLSQQLRDLEECGMIHREVIPEKPPKTLYSLTAFGKSIIPVLDSMCNWGIHFLEGLDITPPCGSKL